MDMSLGKIIDRLGDSNPQIFREFKERLTPRNLGMAIVATLLIQGFTLLYFNSQIPVAMPKTVSIGSPATVDRPDGVPHIEEREQVYSKYCDITPKDYPGELCQWDGADNFKINWQFWRSDVFNCLSWMLALGLILGSVYTLVADLVREEKRGTLNFIRLSPQSAPKIFLGKLLGVPILVYLAAALMVPLHAIFGLSVGATVPLMVGWYATIGAIWFLFASSAILYVLLGGVQAIVTTIGTGFLLWLPLIVVNAYLGGTVNHADWIANESNKQSHPIAWFGLPMNSSAIWIYAFGTCSCAIASYWVWQAIERRYLNPTATAIGKQQSYLINFCLQVWVAGFALPFIFTVPAQYLMTGQTLSIFALFDFVALGLSIFLLLPSKQAVQDWSRHRRESANGGRKLWQRDLVRDLLVNDKSPALLTIAINVSMAMVYWIPVSLLISTKFNHMRFEELSRPDAGFKLLAMVLIAAALILIYAAIAHLALFLKVKKRNVWTIAIIGGATILPLVCAGVLSPGRPPAGVAALVLLFSPFAPIGVFKLGIGTILTAFFVQLGVFATLTRQLQRQVQLSGRSQSQELLARS
jgi:hypothetical protein